MKEDHRKAQSGSHDGTGAKGGKEALSSQEQEPLSVEPDSAVDEQLRKSKDIPSGGLEPNTIVRN